MLHLSHHISRRSCAAARRWSATVLVGLCWAIHAPATLAAGTVQAAPAYTGNVIVRWRDASITPSASAANGAPGAMAGAKQGTAAAEDRLQQLRSHSGVNLAVWRSMAGNMELLGTADGSTPDPEALAAKLRQDPSVADAVPDRWLHLHDTIPNDPEFASAQPYMMGTGTAIGGANLPHAWDRSRGSTNMVVAVLDTGYLPHPDLAGKFLAGYDFISSDTISNDNQPGRDSDATDAGDNVPVGFLCPGSSTATTVATPNSWHGTRVASVLGAVTNNGLGIAGVDWNTRILPVRVSGRCGALLSDTVDGLRWAAGISVPSVPDNPNPARVVNISLGGGTCTSIEQQAINDVVGRGVSVVVAAGNSAGVLEAPADCSGVIAVTAHANDGENASFANVGSKVTISAPGGGCGNSKVVNGACTTTVSVIRTLTNDGTTSLGAYTIRDSQGTSFAAPMVSGVVSLMLAVNPSLTPAQVTAALKSSARPHPSGTFCTTNPGVCGAGLLDADGALSAAAGTSTAAPAPSGGGGGGAIDPWLAMLLGAAGFLALALRRRG
ncbi:MprA protease, GlyGly-CTERM protein-sorting domain-containing form [Cupriavidus sp. WKF15]|uniref:MprA protease, GlyGly-CTERM protein-sorting domain-containing form n=1 Tax=Cupriavidus sp. WKF15 TaxID=3032282 RepID=UPI0023E0D37C|nr:MprA protease, GlyGly-CTERM protein-sorting domain-containing form [Cupriavidus sp. WKF15]WER44819.1 MprA protease, GlyGly-CTERM protein-sorting domain-containing form [Cupriavidus sp. WKF15]